MALVAIIALVATALLVRTERHATGIQDKTQQIAATARGINDYTDSILLLERTNAHAEGVLAALRPLVEPVSQIGTRSAVVADLVDAIAEHSGSIDESSASIRVSSRRIRDGLLTVTEQSEQIGRQLGGLNTSSARILQSLESVRRAVQLIDGDLERTRAVLASILAETGDIHRSLRRTEHVVGCIDRGLNGTGECPGGAGS